MSCVRAVAKPARVPATGGAPGQVQGSTAGTGVPDGSRRREFASCRVEDGRKAAPGAYGADAHVSSAERITQRAADELQRKRAEGRHQASGPVTAGSIEPCTSVSLCLCGSNPTG